jgi:hypothetical protein
MLKICGPYNNICGPYNYTNNNIHIMIFSKVLITLKWAILHTELRRPIFHSCRMQRSTSESNQIMYTYCKVAMAHKLIKYTVFLKQIDER